MIDVTNSMTFARKIWLGFSLVVLLMVGILVVIHVNFLSITQTQARISDNRIPTSHTSKDMLNGVNESLAALRGWLLLKEPKFKQQRAEIWGSQIDHSLAAMERLSVSWTNPENISRLDQLRIALAKFRLVQDDIESIAGSIDNNPAAKILTEQLPPIVTPLLNNITIMIDNESQLQEGVKRKALLKTMADFRASMTRTIADIRMYVLIADPLYLTAFERDWLLNNRLFDELNEQQAQMSGIQMAVFNRLPAARETFRQLVDQMVAIVQGEERDLANYHLAQQAIPVANQIKVLLLKMVNNQEHLLVEDFAFNREELATLEQKSLVLFLIAIVVILALALMIVNAVVNPINRLLEVTASIGRGEYDTDTDLSGSIEMIRLGKAMNLMKQEIATRTNNLEQQNWLSIQETQVTELTQGATDIERLCESVISHLAETLKAGHGLFYIAQTAEQEADSTEPLLTLCGSYAFTERKELSAHIHLGEGLVGQAAKEKKPIHLTQVPGDYIQIASGLGQQTPLNILAQPLLFEDTLVGVIELGSFELFQPHHLTLLQKVSANLGILINNVNNRNRTELLLVETQRQSLELSNQKEELGVVNENLESQAQKLKLSQEELQQQSEELRVSNEELSEKQKALEEQTKGLRQAKADLEDKAQELGTASQYKSEFLANMSHELRTPLNSLLILSKSLAKNEDGNLSIEQQEDAQVIHEGGQSLLALINDIMDLSKVEAGKLAVHTEPVAIASVCQNLDRLFRHVAEEKQLEFILEVDDDIDEVIETDIQRLEQVLKNFLSNAFKFTRTGSVTLSIHRPATEKQLLPEYIEPASALAFSVIDTGIGIPDDKQLAIFEAFQQEDGSINRKYGGTGLGLAISKELAQLLGGEIKLQSTQGQGSVFTLYLPAHKPVTELAVAESVESTPQSKTKSKSSPALPPSNTIVTAAKIPDAARQVAGSQYIDDDRRMIQPDDRILLIIEDDPAFAKILVKSAQKDGFKCLATDKGREGLQLAQQFSPVGVILDLGLPDINGLTVLEQLKFNLKTRHIPVHIVSGADQEKDSLTSGAFSYLSKPIETEQIDDLLSSVKGVLGDAVKEVLVIEDDTGNQQAISRLISSATIQVRCVDSGSRALDVLRAHPVDCIILDLGLPDMSGYELLTTIKHIKGNERVPVIVYTGQDIPDEEYKKLSKISDDIIVKGAESPERLLDDVSLFLHSIQSSLSSEQHATLTMLHDQSRTLEGREILIVDDDMRNIFALSRELEKEGLDTMMAENGKVALEVIAERGTPFDLILMDIMMPEMDGLEATRQIRQLNGYAKVPIIALTAKAMPEDQAACIEAGASEYLTKPVEMERLLSMMQIWLY